MNKQCASDVLNNTCDLHVNRGHRHRVFHLLIPLISANLLPVSPKDDEPRQMGMALLLSGFSGIRIPTKLLLSARVCMFVH